VPRLSSNRGLREGYRSGLELDVADQIRAHVGEVKYEDKDSVLHYTMPETKHRYTPDFVLPNGIVVETKGRFMPADRRKHLLIKNQMPNVDIRFVFSNSKSRISKGSNTTCAMWCEAHGFRYSDRLVPLSWFKEKHK
jgi:hypothetical protein